MSKYDVERIAIPRSIKPKDRVKIANIVLEHIVSRTVSGLDRKNKKFPNYEINYANFKGVGKSDVDLVLSGEMLEELTLVSHKDGEIVIGYKNPSDALSGKVEGNRIGSYGGEPNKDKARDFLGIPKSELEILIAAIEQDIDLDDEKYLSQDEIIIGARSVDPFDSESILDALLKEEFGE